MPDDYNFYAGTAVPNSFPLPETTTSGSVLPGKVGFEGLWQLGWQSITSIGLTGGTSSVSVTSTDSSTDLRTSLPEVKRVRRYVHYYKRA
jgi:hypothetical protein